MTDLVAVELVEYVGVVLDNERTVIVASEVIGAGTAGGGGGGAVDSVNGATGTVTTAQLGAYYPGGTDVAVADGGTGSSTASGARTALSAQRASWIDVREHGATGDGSTDDITSIAAAIAACPEGGTVYFPVPSASYKISTPILPTTNITLRMEHAPRWSYDGGSPCVIKGTAGFTGTALIYINGVDGVRLEHLSLDGGLVVGAGSIHGIATNGTTRDLQIVDVDVTSMAAGSNAGHGLHFASGSKGVKLERVSVYNCSVGFYADNLTDSELDDCLAVSNDNDGFYLINTYETTLVSPRAVFNGANGIHLDGAGSTTSSNSLGQLTLLAPATDRNGQCGILDEQKGLGPIQIVSPRCRRDGSAAANGTDSTSCGIKILGTSGAVRTAPVDIVSPQITPGVGDAGTGTESPMYGIRSTNSGMVNIHGGNVWAVTNAYATGGNDDYTRATPDGLWYNGGRASQAADVPAIQDTYGAGGSISDTAYDATSWNGQTTVAPSQNAVRDKFESLVTGVSSVDGNTGAVTAAQLLTSIKTVDGTGSGLDADLLDGSSAAAFVQVANNLSDVTAATARTNLGAAPLASPTFTGTVTVPNGAALGTPASIDLTNATNAPVNALSYPALRVNYR